MSLCPRKVWQLFTSKRLKRLWQNPTLMASHTGDSGASSLRSMSQLPGIIPINTPVMVLRNTVDRGPRQSKRHYRYVELSTKKTRRYSWIHSQMHKPWPSLWWRGEFISGMMCPLAGRAPPPVEKRHTYAAAFLCAAASTLPAHSTPTLPARSGECGGLSTAHGPGGDGSSTQAVALAMSLE